MKKIGDAKKFVQKNLKIKLRQKSKCDKDQKLKLLQNLKTQYVIKLKKFKCENTQKIKL